MTKLEGGAKVVRELPEVLDLDRVVIVTVTKTGITYKAKGLRSDICTVSHGTIIAQNRGTK